MKRLLSCIVLISFLNTFNVRAIEEVVLQKTVRELAESLANVELFLVGLPRVSSDASVEEKWVTVQKSLPFSVATLRNLSVNSSLLAQVAVASFDSLHKKIQALNRDIKTEEKKLFISETEDAMSVEDVQKVKESKEAVKEVILVLEKELPSLNDELRNFYKKYAPEELKKIEATLGIVDLEDLPEEFGDYRDRAPLYASPEYSGLSSEDLEELSQPEYKGAENFVDWLTTKDESLPFGVSALGKKSYYSPEVKMEEGEEKSVAVQKYLTIIRKLREQIVRLEIENTDILKQKTFLEEEAKKLKNTLVQAKELNENETIALEKELQSLNEEIEKKEKEYQDQIKEQKERANKLDKASDILQDQSQNQIRRLQNRIEGLEDLLKSKDEQVRTVSEKIGADQKQIEDLQLKVSSGVTSDVELEKLKKSLTSSREELRMAQVSKDEADKEKVRLEGDLRSLRAAQAEEKKQLQKEFENKENEYAAQLEKQKEALRKIQEQSQVKTKEIEEAARKKEEELQSSIRDLGRELQEKQDNVQAIQQRLDVAQRAQEQVKQLRSAGLEDDAKIKDLASTIKKFQDDLSQAQIEKETIDIDRQKLATELVQYQKSQTLSDERVASLEDQLSTLQSQLQSEEILKTQLKEAQTQLKEQQKTGSISSEKERLLQAELEANQQKILDLERTSNDLRSQIVDLERIKEESAALKKERDQLEKKLRIKEEALADLENVESEKVDVEEALEEKDLELKRSEALRRTLQSQLQSEEALGIQLKEAQEKAEEQLNEKSKELERAIQERGRARGELERVQGDVRNVPGSEASSASDEELASLQGQVSTLKDQVDAFSSLVESLKIKREGIQKEKEEISKKLVLREERIKELEEQVQREKVEKENLDQSIRDRERNMTSVLEANQLFEEELAASRASAGKRIEELEEELRKIKEVHSDCQRLLRGTRAEFDKATAWEEAYRKLEIEKDQEIRELRREFEGAAGKVLAGIEDERSIEQVQKQEADVEEEVPPEEIEPQEIFKGIRDVVTNWGHDELMTIDASDRIPFELALESEESITLEELKKVATLVFKKRKQLFADIYQHEMRKKPFDEPVDYYHTFFSEAQSFLNKEFKAMFADSNWANVKKFTQLAAEFLTNITNEKLLESAETSKFFIGMMSYKQFEMTYIGQMRQYIDSLGAIDFYIFLGNTIQDFQLLYEIYENNIYFRIFKKSMQVVETSCLGAGQEFLSLCDYWNLAFGPMVAQISEIIFDGWAREEAVSSDKPQGITSQPKDISSICALKIEELNGIIKPMCSHKWKCFETEALIRLREMLCNRLRVLILMFERLKDIEDWDEQEFLIKNIKQFGEYFLPKRVGCSALKGAECNSQENIEEVCGNMELEV